MTPARIYGKTRKCAPQPNQTGGFLSGGLLRELHAQDQVTETIPVHPLARLCRIRTVCIRHERKAFRSASLAVLGQENTCDAAVTLEHLAQVVLLCEFGDLDSCQSQIHQLLAECNNSHS